MMEIRHIADTGVTVCYERPTKGLLMHSSSTDHVVNGRVGNIGDKLLSFSTYTINSLR